MHRKDKAISLLCIGFGIGMCMAVILFFSFYMVYLDIVTSDEMLESYYTCENPAIDEAEIENENIQVPDIISMAGDTVIRIETYGDVIIKEETPYGREKNKE